MKNLLKIVGGLAVVFMAFGQTATAGDLTEREVQIGVNDVYVPSGFDINSDVYVVANGIFPNGCYKWKRADVAHTDAYTHEIKSIASVSQGMCLMVLVPFTKEIKLGKFAAGKHTLRFENGDGTYSEKLMVVEE